MGAVKVNPTLSNTSSGKPRQAPSSADGTALVAKVMTRQETPQKPNTPRHGVRFRF